MQKYKGQSDPCIQFTIERESDGQCPFLDIHLNREEDDSISTSVYRKATHTDRYRAFTPTTLQPTNELW